MAERGRVEGFDIPDGLTALEYGQRLQAWINVRVYSNHSCFKIIKTSDLLIGFRRNVS